MQIPRNSINSDLPHQPKPVKIHKKFTPHDFIKMTVVVSLTNATSSANTFQGGEQTGWKMKEKSVFLFDGRLIFSYVSSSFVHIIILRSVATSSPYSTAQWCNIPYEVTLLYIFNQIHFSRNPDSQFQLWTYALDAGSRNRVMRTCHLLIEGE